MIEIRKAGLHRHLALSTSLTVALALGASSGVGATEAPDRFGGGAGPTHFDGSSTPSAAFVDTIAANRMRLIAEGVLKPPSELFATSFALPLRVRNIGYFSGHGLSNYVDQDPTAGIEDWNCGSRTYDGHQGTDFFSWPFGWLAMDLDRIEVIAAAPGTIIGRSDGDADRSCALGPLDEGNYVVIEHADGSVSTYLHMKRLSVTPKLVGQTVVTGEYLGIVGSSGNSTGPHLHFAAYSDAVFNLAHLIDPWNGTCDVLLGGSTWANPPAYREPRINHLATATLPPVFPACPTQEVPNEQRLFESGDTIHFVPYLADELASTPKTLEIRRPDGTSYHSWNHTADQDYSSSHWWWIWSNFPSEPVQRGRWEFRVTLDGETRVRAFYLDTLFADDFEDANLSAWSSSTP